ncbi:DUF1403 family protein [Pseudorhodobacter sp.]|uniref:DUF1403 family protein n=1 Tax=Pseudorhodobacter sp. TaxID=1934400 RepID=UPI002648CE3D|nr:DUF1403 family protein [Pseudorhodobacter sp.]MDN5786644.1 DUF1403 family protein [Pseudorhodobacter sp.]
MEKTKLIPKDDSRAALRIPGWVARCTGETLEEAAFLSGAALAHLDLTARSDAVPQALWRSRLALTAAEVCVGFVGRRESAGELRDALHLMRPGDHPGPAGEVFQQWSVAVARPISVANLHKALPAVALEQIALCLDATGGNPVGRAAAVLEAVLTDAPRAETAALILADAVLATSLGWDHLLPVLALAMRPRDLRMRGDDLRRTCHRAVVAAAGQALPLAADLARRAARLQAVAPKLRAKGADRAVELFLSRDALAPVALLPFMSDRAARRLCDRLVDLGAVRELTGRDSFRLYGV